MPTDKPARPAWAPALVATHEADLRADLKYYTPARLMGRHSPLWAWGEWLEEGIARHGPSWRDGFATLGTTIDRGKLVDAPLPADPGVLDCCRAWADLGAIRDWRDGGRHPHPWAREPWSVAQMIVYLYYGKGHGHPLPADPRNREHYKAALKRWGVNGRVGDGAVAELLRFLPELQRSTNTEMLVYGRRRRAIFRMSAFLSHPQEGKP